LKCHRQSKESIEKIRQKRIGQFSGNKHPMWQENSKRRSDEMILCLCGCGNYIKKYDYRGRLKKYMNGHTMVGRTRVFSEKWIENIKVGQRKSIKMRGENHWNWQGGITDPAHKIRQSTEYKEWRMAVYQRDHFSCVKCGYRSCKPKDIVADHIKPFYFFPELRLVVSNGRTLCRKCDKEIAFNYGKDKYKYLKLTCN
jgi:hypothetical protein